MVKVRWAGGRVHTRCGAGAGEPRLMQLRVFNMLWWAGRVCRTCVPDPVMSEAAAEKVPWPFAGGTVRGVS